MNKKIEEFAELMLWAVGTTVVCVSCICAGACVAIMFVKFLIGN